MKKIKILISSIVIITIICITTLSFATSMISEGASDIKNTATGIKNGIENTANDIKNGISTGVSDIKNDAISAKDNMVSDVDNTKNTISGDIRNGIDKNNTTNTTTNTTNTRNVTNYTTTPVAYNNDTVNFFGLTMSRTSMILLVTALAAIIIAILVYSYVTQDNDRYSDDDI